MASNPLLPTEAEAGYLLKQKFSQLRFAAPFCETAGNNSE